jgi:hypothetical protein
VVVLPNVGSLLAKSRNINDLAIFIDGFGLVWDLLE